MTQGRLEDVRVANLDPSEGDKLGFATLAKSVTSDVVTKSNVSSDEALVATTVTLGLAECFAKEIAKQLEGIKDNLMLRPRGKLAPVKHTREGIPSAPRIL